jgi:hypothetical protein
MPQTFQSAANLPATNCTRQNIYDLIESILPLAALVDVNSLQILSNKITAGDRTPYWRKYTKVFTDFATAATTNSIDLFSLPAGAVILAVKLKHSVPFTGGALSAYTISVGITGTLAKYLAAQNVFAAVSPTNYGLGATIGGESHTASTPIKATATSTGGNLSVATAGIVDVWVLWSVLV